MCTIFWKALRRYNPIKLKCEKLSFGIILSSGWRMTRLQPCIVCSVIVVARDHNPLGVTEQRTHCDCQKSQSRQQYLANQQWNKTRRIASKHSGVEGEQLLSVDHSLYFNTTRNYNHLQKWFIISHVNFHRYLKTLRRPGAPIWAFIDNDFPEWNIRAAPGPWSVDRRAPPSIHHITQAAVHRFLLIAGK